MLIGVISDTHDNLLMIDRALKALAERRVDAILHAGDIVSPFALRLILKAGIPLMGVFGNNDGERTGLKKLCSSINEPTEHLELGGRAIILAHDPEALEGIQCGGADLVIHGHTHEGFVRPGKPLTLNPGECGGWLTGRSTVAVVDLDEMSAEIVEVGRQETVKL